MQKPDDIPEDVWETASECVGVGGGYELRGVLHTQRTDIARAILAERERCAKVAERDADWSRFGKKEIGQWEGGPDGARDYRLSIAAGRAIASAIRSQP